MAVSQSLSVTEVSGSVNTTANTSQVRILWQSTQTGDSWNGYTRTAKYYVSINGGAETEYSVSYTLPQNSTKTIVDTTITINHRNDGSGSVSVRTWMDTSISAGVVQKSKTLNLTTIPRASTITAAYAVTLGNNCKIIFTPASASFYYKIHFSLGTWNYITAAFRPSVTSAYTYTEYTIPMDVASNFPNDPSGTMTATLYTYSDSGATQVGSASTAQFTVTLPNNATTKPSVTMSLSPVTPYAKFSSLYLKGISKVKATFGGSGKYGASISAYSLQAEGGGHTEASISNTHTSNILAQSGEVKIIGWASDSREYGNSIEKKITVIPYVAPYISPSSGYKKVICERCTSGGTASDSGAYLHIKGTRNYTKINTNGIVNTCAVRCRIKPEGGSWSHNSGEGVDVLKATNTSTDNFDLVLPDITLSTTLTYVVELNITDDTGLSSYIEFRIPSESADFDLREGGKGAAFGKPATKENFLECELDAQFNNRAYFSSLSLMETEIEVGGDDNTYYPVYVKHGEGYRNTNTQPVFLGLGKMLDTKSGDWEGNHSSYTSSISMAWLYRVATWDGNGEYIIPIYKREGFAKLLAHIAGFGELLHGVVLYLRGGGATYRLVSSVPIEPRVYLDSTNISTNPTYPVVVSPRGYVGNLGIQFTNGIVEDFVVEQGTSDIWEYRKWYSGKVECWGKWAVGMYLKNEFGSLFYNKVDAHTFPSGLFTSAPKCQVTAECRGTDVWAWIGVASEATKDYAPAVVFFRPTKVEDAVGYNILYYAIGTWK